ncbi:D-tagatose-1,6-bisphosphate aldolase subunit KbaZ [bioreactor metagenome]|uniref:D-tagatose-1,6-bisphosphate aldolase subunit KbaZ n=1 Tax=bioreactor metagenome TaxID=1076179 RepID=A0A644XFX9_9ZZZZ
MKHLLQRIAEENHAGKPAGIYSCCSANEYVLRAALRKAKRYEAPVLIEATANQVNQFGGYTGQTPEQFYGYVLGLADQIGLPRNRVILGGDHLGPLTFSMYEEERAMANAGELVRQYVLAGFTKIHIDTSMRVADDDSKVRLPDEIIARRGAELCAWAEAAYAERKTLVPDAVPPVYVIGSEVPIPGGEQHSEKAISVTTQKDLGHTIETFHAAFLKRNLEDAWQRVIAVVAQVGVEFGGDNIFEYNRQNASSITKAVRGYPNLVLEGHSTDYQTKYALREMVEDAVAILKVGPALTFAVREGLFALENIEKELFAGKNIRLSGFRGTLDEAMVRSDGNWAKYYRGTKEEQKFQRAYSLSDRARYYLTEASVSASVKRLLENLQKFEIPYPLLSQYLPRQAEKIRLNGLGKDPAVLLEDHVGDVIEDYLYATFYIDGR